jgi:hypothetical protein
VKAYGGKPEKAKKTRKEPWRQVPARKGSSKKTARQKGKRQTLLTLGGLMGQLMKLSGEGFDMATTVYVEGEAGAVGALCAERLSCDEIILRRWK